MENDKHIYKVAGHSFSVCLDHVSFNSERMQQCYVPFEVETSKESPLFTVSVADEIRTNDVLNKIYSEKRKSAEYGQIEVFATNEGWLFEQSQPYSETANAFIRIDKEFKQARIALRGSEMQCCFAFNSAVMLCYLLTTHYEVDEQTARLDAEELLSQWQKAGIIE